jgi:hypothetical protein
VIAAGGGVGGHAFNGEWTFEAEETLEEFCERLGREGFTVDAKDATFWNNARGRRWYPPSSIRWIEEVPQS